MNQHLIPTDLIVYIQIQLYHGYNKSGRILMLYSNILHLTPSNYVMCYVVM